MTVGQCINAYGKLSEGVFGHPNWAWKNPEAQFKASKLERAVKDTVMSYGINQDPGEKMVDIRKDSCKVFDSLKSLLWEISDHTAVLFVPSQRQALIILLDGFAHIRLIGGTKTAQFGKPHEQHRLLQPSSSQWR
jgi:hypothetical protein